MHAAFDGADRNRVSDEIGLKAGLDDKQPADVTNSRHWLSKRHANGAVPPFPD
jgi:hypothetical protein